MKGMPFIVLMTHWQQQEPQPRRAAPSFIRRRRRRSSPDARVAKTAKLTAAELPAR
jgi:hypothetical protein